MAKTHDVDRDAEDTLRAFNIGCRAARDAIMLGKESIDLEHLANNVIDAIIKAWNNNYSIRGDIEDAQKALRLLLKQRASDIRNGNASEVAKSVIGMLWDRFEFEPRL